MNPPPSFFVPLVAEEKHEACYQDLAKAISVAAAPFGRRVYSITFGHNGEVWTATVGQPLSGTVDRTQKVRGRKVERTFQLSNASVVMAIFASSPFFVWHDGRSKTWENPFMAGEPLSVTYFSE